MASREVEEAAIKVGILLDIRQVYGMTKFTFQRPQSPDVLFRHLEDAMHPLGLDVMWGETTPDNEYVAFALPLGPSDLVLTHS